MWLKVKTLGSTPRTAGVGTAGRALTTSIIVRKLRDPPQSVAKFYRES